MSHEVFFLMLYGENTGHVELRFAFCAWQNAAEIILRGPLGRPLSRAPKKLRRC